MSNATQTETFTPTHSLTAPGPFSAPHPARWATSDGIEVCEAPAFPGRNPARAYVAQRFAGGPCAWGATRELAVAAVRGI